ncbi:MAG: hypothetical protein AAF960_01095 [Bacteroidota bacterium]
MGSGFMNQAIESLKNNRKSVREKTNRFRQRKKYQPPKKKRTTNKGSNEDSWQLKMADKRRQNKIKLELGILALIMILGTVIFLRIGNQFVVNSISDYQNEIREMEAFASIQKQKEVYFTMVKRGESDLENQNWQAAHRNFYQAVKLYPNGKKGNLGLTKSLIYQCAYENKYCEESINYYDQMMASGMYSDEVMENLAFLMAEIPK